VNLLLLEPGEVHADGLVVLGEERARHLRTVLRVEPGHVVRTGIIDGPMGTGIVQALDDTSVTLRCAMSDLPQRPRVDLMLALPRPKVLRRLWAQLAALGVARIVLTNAERVERNYFDTHLLDPRTYRPLLVEGLQQARDTRLPVVSVHRQFRKLVEDELDAASTADVRVVADPSSDSSLFTAVRASARRVLLAVGPEGGWNAFELELMQKHAFATVGMGNRTLRSDTACVALLALVHEALRPAH
jgi:RsmE family RNA methyltransferase